MGCLQVKRWLSFLPAAFVVYILLHYLVYQPDLTGPQPVLVPGARTSNGSLVPGTLAGARVLPPAVQEGEAFQVVANDVPTQPLVLQEAASATSAALGGAVASEVGSPPQAAAASTGSESPQQQQNTGRATTSVLESGSPARYASAPQALGGISIREPLSAALPQQEEITFLSDEGGLIGSGDLDTSPPKGESGLRESPPGLEEEFGAGVPPSPGVSRATNVVSPPPPSPEDSILMGLESSFSLSSSGASSSFSSSSSPNGDLLKDSPGDDALHKALPPSHVHFGNVNNNNNTVSSAGDPPKGLAYEHDEASLAPQSLSPNHPPVAPPQYSPNSLTDFDPLDAAFRGAAASGGGGGFDDPLQYDRQRYPYPLYSEGQDPQYSPYQHYQLPGDVEEALQRDPYGQISEARMEAGNLNGEIPRPVLPKVTRDQLRYAPPYTRARGQPLSGAAAAASGEHAMPQGQPGVPSHTAVRVTSTVQAVSQSSSASGSGADKAGKETPASGAAAPAIPPQAAAAIAIAKSKQQPPNMVVVQGTGSAPQPKQTVTKKTTVVRKSNVASSSTLSINALSGRTKVGEKYESGFSVPHEELCVNNGRDLKVLVLITTAPDHEKHRTAVRQTWGHFAIRKDVVMAFVVGRTTNPNIQNNIDKENEIYGDIVQANFIDHYANLTLKTISMFEWVKTYCSESHFILKTDDDMFINMPLLLTFIDSKKNDRRVMYGRLAKGWKPVRNKKSKYYIDVATYKKTKYPDFLTGPAYLFTCDIVDDIYQKALGTTFFVLEDVLVTGIVGESLRIKRVGDSRFRNEKIKLTDTCSLMKTVSIHMVKYEEQFDIYKRTLDGKAKCKTG